MTLEITTYSEATLVRALSIEEFEPETHQRDGLTHLHASDDYPQHADGMVAGLYRVTEPGEHSSLTFSAYHYDTWRDHLCLAMTGIPLDELIHREDIRPYRLSSLLEFSDQEGLIGAVTSAKIRDEFSAAWGSIETHVNWLNALCGKRSESETLVNGLIPTDSARRSRLIASINDREYAPWWKATCHKVAALFQVPGQSGCVLFF